MGNADTFLKELKNHIGEWVCARHTVVSTQSAAVFREVKNQGYQFEEYKTNRWGKPMYCPVCGTTTTHYKLLNPNPVFKEQKRYGIDNKSRIRVIDILEGRDAFTGASIASTPEIDHKVPWTRLEEDIDIKKLSNDEIKDNFQLLTREHNLLKDRMCKKCKEHNIRPPFLEIPFWYEGNEEYKGNCIGCGWYDGKAWRNALKELIEKKQ